MTVTTSLRLGLYVKSLEINPRHKHDDWIYKIHQVLPRLLPNLVCLTYRDFPVVHPLFFVLSPRFNSITHLAVSDMKSWTFREIVRLLDRFTQLKTLRVDNCLWRSPSHFYRRQREKNPPVVTSFKLPTQSLTPPSSIPSSSSDNVYNIANWLTTTFPTHSLTRFSFAPPDIPLQSPDFRDLLYQCSGVLKELKLVIHPSYYALGRPDDLDIETTWLPAITSCQKLQRITFVASSPGDPWFLGLLLSRYLPSSLSVISLQLYRATTLSQLFPSDSEWINAFWEEFDSSVTNLSRFPKLASIVLKWNLDQPPDLAMIPNEALVRHMNQLRESGIFKEVLPRLYDSGILLCGLYEGNVVYRSTESAASTVTREDTTKCEEGY
ncbi:hypothetical protein NLI96_g2199 [Meripilus lineatus]|uniref:Uncharacterized protein n=1 Tax=Meripilus lineatus TaxID=2056292 RepID=A0AAD5V8S7_9APHY|nr:hypothetical protein NLI96_g2199 [Physisporinus lineatus]